MDAEAFVRISTTYRPNLYGRWIPETKAKVVFEPGYAADEICECRDTWTAKQVAAAINGVDPADVKEEWLYYRRNSLDGLLGVKIGRRLTVHEVLGTSSQTGKKITRKQAEALEPLTTGELAKLKPTKTYKLRPLT